MCCDWLEPLVAPIISKVLIGCCSEVWWTISTVKDNFTLFALLTASPGSRSCRYFMYGNLTPSHTKAPKNVVQPSVLRSGTITNFIKAHTLLELIHVVNTFKE